jgi:hemerythrin-like domain-containing protein
MGRRSTVQAAAASERIPRVIEQLRRDHGNMERLLQVVEAEMDLYRSGGVPDFDILRSIMEYILHYPDLFHHPKEDLLFERMVNRNSAVAGVVAETSAEHRELMSLAQRLAAAIRNVEQDAQLPRDWFDSLARRYVTSLRRHMQREENNLFKVAQGLLEAKDWAEIDARLDSPDDPVFGSNLQDSYVALARRISRLAR